MSVSARGGYSIAVASLLCGAVLQRQVSSKIEKNGKKDDTPGQKRRHPRKYIKECHNLQIAKRVLLCNSDIICCTKSKYDEYTEILGFLRVWTGAHENAYRGIDTKSILVIFEKPFLVYLNWPHKSSRVSPARLTRPPHSLSLLTSHFASPRSDFYT